MSMSGLESFPVSFGNTEKCILVPVRTVPTTAVRTVHTSTSTFHWQGFIGKIAVNIAACMDT